MVFAGLCAGLLSKDISFTGRWHDWGCCNRHDILLQCQDAAAFPHAQQNLHA